jgi:hypothetical protein
MPMQKKSRVKKKEINTKSNKRHADVMVVAGWLLSGIHKREVRIMIAKKFDLASLNAQNRLINEALEEINKNAPDTTSLRQIALESIEELAAKYKDTHDAFYLKSLDTYLKHLDTNKKEVSVDTGNTTFNIKFQ